MAQTTIKIVFDVEPIVKLVCTNFECKFNMMNLPEDKSMYCMLKYLEIDKDGQCAMREMKTDGDNKTG